MNGLGRPAALEELADRLAGSPDYRVLRRLVAGDIPSRRLQGPGNAVILDVETTGLEHEIDDVVELAMVKFTFDGQGQVGGIAEKFQSLRQPRSPIPPQITDLTGVTNADVAGKELDLSAVAQFLADVQLVIAHNAAFDRPFCERLWSGFRELPWACSATQIDWQNEGIVGSRLEYVTGSFGRFYAAHRAADDCVAVLYALSQALPRTGERALHQLLRNARKSQARVFALGASYDSRLLLRKRGYRWNDGLNGFPRSWWRDVDLEEIDRERAFLAQISTKTPIEPFLFKLTAWNRFRKSFE